MTRTGRWFESRRRELLMREGAGVTLGTIGILLGVLTIGVVAAKSGLFGVVPPLVLLAWALVMAVLALIYTSTLPKIYKANVLLQINNQATMIFDKDGRTVSNVGAGEFYKTQYRLLTSRSLAQRVIEQTGLEQELLNDSDQNPLREFYTKLKNRLFGGAAETATSQAQETRSSIEDPSRWMASR